MTTQYSSSTPSSSTTISSLETLIVRQLEEVLREERLLAERYRLLDSAGLNTSEMSTFSADINRFDQRADRLYRLMEALDACCSTVTAQLV